MTKNEEPRIIRRSSVRGGWRMGGGYYYEWFVVYPDGRELGPFDRKKQAQKALDEA